MDFIFQKDILKDKVVIITGGASGIGAGISESFAKAGANLVIASRRKEICKSFADKLSSTYNINAIGKELDVRESTSINQVFREAHSELGSIDILINNAAGNFYFPAHKMRDKLWQTVIDIDLNGTFYCSRAAFPYFKQAGGGCIINTTMTLHYQGWVGMAHATSAKAGIDALTKTLALEWGEYNIRVNAVAPGPIPTEGAEKAFQANKGFDEFISRVPLKKNGTPQDVGQLMVFMASNASSWMTGSIIVLDGGESLAKNRAMLSLTEVEEAMKNRKKH